MRSGAGSSRSRETGWHRAGSTTGPALLYSLISQRNAHFVR
jgi:hypothetical protein